MCSDSIQSLVMGFALLVSRTHRPPATEATGDLVTSMPMADNQNTATVDIMNRRTFAANALADPVLALCLAGTRLADNGQPMGMSLSAAECLVSIPTRM